MKQIIFVFVFASINLVFSAVAEEPLSRQEIKNLQSTLNEIGYSVGGADGLAGKRTLTAIERMFSDHSSVDEGKLGKGALELANSIASSRYDPPTEYFASTKFGNVFVAASVDLTKTRNPCEQPRCMAMDFLMAVMDLNHDGFQDLVYGTYWEIDGQQTTKKKPVIFMISDGKGRYLPWIDDPILDLVHPREALVADFNADGRDDLFVVDPGKDSKPFPGAQNALLLSIEDKMLNVTETNLPVLIDFAHGAASGDLDGDGDIDILIVTNQSKAVRHDSYVLENDGTGKFSRNAHPSYISKSLLSLYSEGRDFSLNNTVEIGDYDGDGFVDIAWLTSGDAPSVAAKKPGAKFTHITYNDGNNNYLSKNTKNLPLARWGHSTFVTDLRQVDIDADGDLDLISTSNTRLPKNGRWRGAFIDILENLGSRHFINVTHQKLFPQGYPNTDTRMWNHWVYPVDLNNDGRTDFATWSLDPVSIDGGPLASPVKVAYQNENGRFVPALNSAVAAGNYNMRRMRPVDIDNDGDIDLVGSSLLRGSNVNGERNFLGFNIQTVTNHTISSWK